LISFILLLHSNEPVRPIAWCVIGLCTGLYLFFNGFRLLQRRHLILDTPVSKIRSASMGMVELSGLAVGPYTMIAPITTRPCHYYRTVVWEWKRQGRSNAWVKVAAECMHVPFFLDDNTGKVMVDPRGAELDLHRDFQQEFCDSFFTLKPEAPPNVHAFLSRHGISTSNKIRVEEFCIKPKNALFVLGTLDENPGLELTPQPIQDDEHNTLTSNMWSNPLRAAASSTLSFVNGRNNSTPDRQSVSEFLTAGSASHQYAFEGSAFAHSPLGKSIHEEESRHAASSEVIQLSPESTQRELADMTQQEKIAAALRKAGIQNPAAWAPAKVAPTKPAATTSNSQTTNAAATDAFDPHPPVVLMKGKNNPTFLISWRSQREIARSLGWRCTLMIWGGPAVALLFLYGLLTLTHVI
jgi:E3 Ubiquitin ligase